MAARSVDFHDEHEFMFNEPAQYLRHSVCVITHPGSWPACLVAKVKAFFQ